MIYFCADDYGISAEGNKHIEDCLKNGILNKVSVIPNGEITNFKERLITEDNLISLHINLVEGKPLTASEDVNLLVSENGNFKYSFIGLYLLTLTFKRKEVEKQLYKEIKKQIEFWKDAVGDEYPIFLDSHQHTHMIPLVFRTLMRVIKDENISIRSIRIPEEPVSAYLAEPSMYIYYGISGIIKQWVLKFCALLNRKEIKKSKINPALFMGVMFSGNLNEIKIRKLLPHYLKLAQKKGKDIEIGFHPGYMDAEGDLIAESREGFKKFYLSSRRRIEYDTLMNLKSDI